MSDSAPFDPGSQPLVSVGSNPPVRPRPPLRSLPQPTSGPALLSWARGASDHFGIDLVQMVYAWGEDNCILAEVKDWDIGDVTDCHAQFAKFLDQKGLLDLSSEARAQMAAREPQERLRDLGPPELPPRPADAPQSLPGPPAASPAPYVDPLAARGSLTIENRDPLVNLKRPIVATIHRVGRVAFGKVLNDKEAADFLKTRLIDHRLPLVESIRNCHDRRLLQAILKAIQEDERDQKHF